MKQGLPEYIIISGDCVLRRNSLPQRKGGLILSRKTMGLDVSGCIIHLKGVSTFPNGLW